MFRLPTDNGSVQLKFVMNIFFQSEELLHLITSLYTLTGIRANIFDLSGRDICLDKNHLPFCEKVNGCAEGHSRCQDCDARAIRHCASQTEVYYYRCHAGICEAILPICSEGKAIAFLVFGQYLDSTPIEEQWERARAGLSWYSGDMEELHREYCTFPQYTKQEITAYTEILKALGSYIYLTGMIQMTEYSDLQRLNMYLDQHYMEKLSLATISEALNISRTKLCSMAKQLSGGSTLSRMIAERRIGAAKLMLQMSNVPISEVASTVGIHDYNYFTKVFRSVTGMTPRDYRNNFRHNY